MYPELFKIPFTEGLTVKSYGVMMVLGFLAAVAVIRHLSRDITRNPEHITNAALYALIAGVVGARLFYVIHYFEKFRADWLSIFAVWKGGLELLGGVVLAIGVIYLYLRRHKLPVLPYLDILAIALMLALAFGRIGCFLNGCCFGKPSNLPWAVRFPYGSLAYQSQVIADPGRGRSEPYLKLPDSFFTSAEQDGQWVSYLKSRDLLTDEQKEQVTTGPYRCMAVHPTQLYSCVNALLLCLILYLIWRRSRTTGRSGTVFALAFILYGITRFFIEFVRDDTPYELYGLTISQLLGIGAVVFGLALLAAFAKRRPAGA